MSPQKNIDPSATTNGFKRLVAELFVDQEAFAEFNESPKAVRLEILARFPSPITKQQIESLRCQMASWRSRSSTTNKMMGVQ